MSAQVADYTGLIIAVTFIVFFFGLAGYMIKRSMDLDKGMTLQDSHTATANTGTTVNDSQGERSCNSGRKDTLSELRLAQP